MKIHRQAILAAVTGCAALFASGCARFQTKQIEQRHWALNESIRQTGNEQLLLNIVRMRYDERPFFLEVATITASFSTSGSLGASGQIPDGGPNVLGLSGSISHAETPTVTWSLPDSREYFGRLMAPMGADQLTVLAHSGWDPELVLRAGVKKMNRLRNVECQVGQGFFEPDSYLEFFEVAHLVHELNRAGLIDFAYGDKSSPAGAKFPLAQLDTTAIPDGLAYGLQYMTRDDPNTVEPLKLTKPLFLRFSKESDNDDRAKRLRSLLNLNPAKYSFGIVDTANSGVEQLRSESGRVTQAFDPETEYAEITLNNRSVMEILYFASRYVDVPVTDLDRKLVSADTSRPDKEWFKILTSPSEPAAAWLKVKYRGHWFYIAADDVSTRATFTLLDAIFASVVGNVTGAKPLLTLPVK